jgi:hypothetical protein
MQTIAPAPQDEPLNLLADWISREQLARELGLTCDTLSRWEARQIGPSCTRIGRKVFYRRDTVRAWLLAQEQQRKDAAKRAAPRRAGGRR